ncbi:acyltransferase, WS/DGAT/MGAT [Amycolatopsis arida]|uniref:diacylglycerol O-acyltransferase n=1 Tax=Amycolatopsis arida TaxID=587909 RepID=A0A1I5KRV9_9PSEU|nr:wax ester/triacylglycerol synthase domain-containing protein [Amycolatopsis arida]TDX83561.1 WS/DGAT/MGAT family acyltransferase [Amycolatopsis arida]SFO87819.1 acyltransferase, WS/DGAT/MGAT [Amycolatopsis arida]
MRARFTRTLEGMFRGPPRGVPRETPSSFRRAGHIERASAADLMMVASDLGNSPLQIAGILVLEPERPPDLAEVRAAIAERIRPVRRFRQRLLSVPPGCGRPIWQDHAEFDVAEHVRHVPCPAPGDEEALLDLAARITGEPLPADRPLWSATWVTGLAGDRAALIVTYHHVLADGIGGLAVLANLVDGVRAEPPADFPRPRPTSVALAADALRGRLRALARLPSGVARLRAAVAELLPSVAGRPLPSALNRRTGPRRRFTVARVKMAEVRKTVRGHGVQVNDVVLTAATAALHTVLRRRGEPATEFTVSVPVSARHADGHARLGNQVGVIPVALPACGPRQLERVAETMRRRTRSARGASVVLLAPAFRLLHALGLLRGIVERQRFVSTSVTYLRGPGIRLSLLGAPITDIIPVTTIKGNITVSFIALSYGGTLTVTVIADPDHCPDLPGLSAALQEKLDELAGLP